MIITSKCKNKFGFVGTSCIKDFPTTGQSDRLRTTPNGHKVSSYPVDSLAKQLSIAWSLERE